MENERLIKPKVIKTKDICVAQLLYGGDGKGMTAIRAYENEPHTFMVGYIINDAFFVDRFQRYIPLYKTPSILETASGDELKDALELIKERDRKFKKGVYAKKMETKLDFVNLPPEIEERDIEHLLQKLENLLYSKVSKYGTRELTELINVEKHFLEDNSLDESLSTGTIKR